MAAHNQETFAPGVPGATTAHALWQGAWLLFGLTLVAGMFKLLTPMELLSGLVASCFMMLASIARRLEGR